MNPNIQRPPTSWPLIILFLIIMISVVIAAIAYYNYQKETLLYEKQQELSAISDLKIRQITQWRFERIADGKFLGDDMILVRKLAEIIDGDPAQAPDKQLKQTLKSLIENFDYSNILLVSKQGNIRLSFPQRDSLAGDHISPLLPGITSRRKVEITDMHISGRINVSHLDLIVPLIDQNISDTVLLGFMVMTIDPRKVLYPLIQSWPTPSKTAETLIVRKDGDEIVYLNELRHRKKDETVLRRSIFEENLPAAMAMRGIKGTINGTDYRNIPVVASMKKIPGTQWYMIAKIDREEVFAVLYGQMQLVVTILVLFILTIGLFLGFLLWNQRVVFYREKYETELNQLALFKHFDYILKFANDIILLSDKDLKIVEANDRAADMYMYPREELIGMSLEKISAGAGEGELQKQISLVNENNSCTYETFHKRKDGSVFPLEISARVVNIEGSKYYQIIGRDITERKLAEETLRESELRFRKIFEESPFPMVITGKDFGIVRANGAFCTMTGYTEEELKLITLGDLTDPDDTRDDPVNLMRLIAEDFPVYHKEKRYKRKDGSVILGSSTTSIIHNNRDEVQYFLGMVEDITEKRKAENDLIAAKLKAEESDRLKTAFLHNVSHEIRTPMNAIIGFSSLLNDPELDVSERQQFTEIIFQSSNQLLSIINDIVDVANIESGQVKVHLKRVDLNYSLRNLNEQYSYGVRQHPVPITLSTGLPDEESVIVTDNTKLVQIISNLLNNSIKFTREGQIEFGYTLRDSFLEFYVKDTGIGIPEESLGKIFDRFYQVDRTVSRQFGGTGLGLSICKAYVELLGGKILVSSEQCKGTTFLFTIPYLKPQDHPVSQG